MERHRESLHLRKDIIYHEHSIVRNIDIEAHFEISEVNEEHVIVQWRKDDLCNNGKEPG